MPAVKWLTAIPFIGLLIGVYFVNKVEPYVLGMPFLLFWCVLWVILTTVIMFIVYKNDPENKEGDMK